MTDIIPIRRALVSVSDKSKLVDLARELAAHDVEIISTGGSAAALRDAGVPVLDVSDYTGFPEILDGRVKTLVPHIHGGLLARRDSPAHLHQIESHGIKPIDLLVSNLYPFEQTVQTSDDYDLAVEMIDVGGPAMIRAAAKNHASVMVITAIDQYGELTQALRDGGSTLDTRRRLAAMAYAHTASYDAAVASWFARQQGIAFPAKLTLTASLQQTLRYGENPHQKAALYTTNTALPGVANSRQIQGKELSYNNINDTEAAFECVSEFDEPTVVIVKHANPCGVASGPSVLDAWQAALRCDPTSAFGGIIATNRTLDVDAAVGFTSIFSEVIIAPDATPEAMSIIAKKKNLRLLLTGAVADSKATGNVFKSITGGLLVQSRDAGRVQVGDFSVVTQKSPDADEVRDLLFAYRVSKYVKSNAIVYARSSATTGIGAGQMSRVDSARLAAWKAEAARDAAQITVVATARSVAASDAFFPFADGLEAIIAAGATAVIQPGGSKRDSEVIAAANNAGIAMVFTGMRHFRH